MQLVTVNEKIISGLSIRTRNALEMNPETAQIGKLIQRFDQNIRVNFKEGARVYSVYFDYESDVSGEYTMLAGADRIESSKEVLQEVTIRAGTYLMFSGCGEVPQMVIDTWSTIWQYFSDPKAAHQRAYTTDFEFYPSQHAVEIYIAIK